MILDAKTSLDTLEQSYLTIQGCNTKTSISDAPASAASSLLESTELRTPRIVPTLLLSGVTTETIYNTLQPGFPWFCCQPCVACTRSLDGCFCCHCHFCATLANKEGATIEETCQQAHHAVKKIRGHEATVANVQNAVRGTHRLLHFGTHWLLDKKALALHQEANTPDSGLLPAAAGAASRDPQEFRCVDIGLGCVWI